MGGMEPVTNHAFGDEIDKYRQVDCPLLADPAVEVSVPKSSCRRCSDSEVQELLDEALHCSPGFKGPTRCFFSHSVRT